MLFLVLEASAVPASVDVVIYLSLSALLLFLWQIRSRVKIDVKYKLLATGLRYRLMAVGC